MFDGIEYEIVASEEAIAHLRELFNEKKQHTFEALNYLNKPFNELRVDDERTQYGDS